MSRRPASAAVRAAELRRCEDVPDLLVHQAVLVVGEALGGFALTAPAGPVAAARHLHRLVGDAERVAVDAAACPPDHPVRPVSSGALRLVSDLADAATHAVAVEDRGGSVPPPVVQLVDVVRRLGEAVVSLARSRSAVERRRCAADAATWARAFDELTWSVLLELHRDVPADPPVRRLVRLVALLAVSVTAAEHLARAVAPPAGGRPRGRLPGTGGGPAR